MSVANLPSNQRDLIARLVGAGRLSRSQLARWVTAGEGSSLRSLVAAVGVDASPELIALAESASDAPGPRSVGRYALGGVLGRGGMGTVHRAYDPVLHRQVAVKLMHPNRAGSAEAVTRFEREAGAVSLVEHPALVALHDFGEHEGRPFFVMELVEGVSFEVWLKSGERSLDATAGIVRTVALALSAAHERGIVHRDVKPENVLVEPGGRARLSDFGLIHREDEAGLTESGQILGTPLYMAPEQALGGAAVGRWSDVYGVGGLLYRALAGRPPNRCSGTILDVLRWLRDESVPTLLPAPPGAAQDLATLAMRCLEKDATRRPAMAAVVEELDRIHPPESGAHPPWSGAPGNAGGEPRQGAGARALAALLAWVRPRS